MTAHAANATPAAATNSRTVAVAGATGFVGRAVVRELLSRGYAVRVLARDRAKARDTLGSEASLAQLAAPARLERARELREGGACERALVVAEPLVPERGGLDEAAWLQAVGE
jgi:nucleoside-diphosphate-sugar epimerase